MTAFCLRPWRKTDAVSLVCYADDPGIAANLRDVFPSPYTRPDADNFIRDCLEREGRDREIRARFDGGNTRALAAQFRLSERQIRKIINGTRT